MDDRKVNLVRKMLQSDPEQAFRFAAADEGLHPDSIEHAQELFGQAHRIDLVEMRPAKKGFILIIDQHFSLWFYRKGNYFEYDGFEIGPYGLGSLDPEDSKEVQ